MKKRKGMVLAALAAALTFTVLMLKPSKTVAAEQMTCYIQYTSGGCNGTCHCGWCCVVSCDPQLQE